MVFSVDETANKAVVYAGVPDKGNTWKGLEVSEWLTVALGPLKGRCGKGKGGLAQGQVSDTISLRLCSFCFFVVNVWMCCQGQLPLLVRAYVHCN